RQSRQRVLGQPRHIVGPRAVDPCRLDSGEVVAARAAGALREKVEVSERLVELSRKRSEMDRFLAANTRGAGDEQTLPDRKRGDGRPREAWGLGPECPRVPECGDLAGVLNGYSRRSRAERIDIEVFAEMSDAGGGGEQGRELRGATEPMRERVVATEIEDAIAVDPIAHDSAHVGVNSGHEVPHPHG